jgi:hypothetical protein
MVFKNPTASANEVKFSRPAAKAGVEKGVAGAVKWREITAGSTRTFDGSNCAWADVTSVSNAAAHIDPKNIIFLP